MLARRPEGTEFTISSDNSTRQAQAFDDARQEIIDENKDEGENTIRKNIQLEINGTWVDVGVDIASLREALGLPPHDLFSQGIFPGYVHRDHIGPTVRDTEHEGGRNGDVE